jgi:LemA protein
MMMQGRHADRAAVIGLAAVMLSGCSYSKIAEQHEAVKTEWAQVQKDLQLRNDLIPGLVDALEDYAPEQLLRALADSRERLSAARTPEHTIAAANEQSAVLADVLPLTDKHPQLKEHESFSGLIKELTTAEARIAVERMRYNARVQQYNTSRRPFGAMLTSLILNRDEYPFFEVPARAHEAPKAGADPPPHRD